MTEQLGFNQNLIIDVVDGIGTHDSFPYTTEEVIEIFRNKSGGVYSVEEFKELWGQGHFQYDSACVYGVTGPTLNEFIDFLRVRNSSEEIFSHSQGEGYCKTRFLNIDDVFNDDSNLNDLESVIKEFDEYKYAKIVIPSIMLSHIDETHLTVFCIPPDAISYRNRVSSIEESVTSYEFEILLNELNSLDSRMSNIVFVWGIPIW